MGLLAMMAIVKLDGGTMAGFSPPVGLSALPRPISIGGDLGTENV